MLLVDLLIYAALRARRPGKVPPPSKPTSRTKWHLCSRAFQRTPAVLTRFPRSESPVPAWAARAISSSPSLQTPSSCLWVFLQLPVLWQCLTLFRFQSSAQIHRPTLDRPFLICLERRFLFYIYSTSSKRKKIFIDQTTNTFTFRLTCSSPEAKLDGFSH